MHPLSTFDVHRQEQADLLRRATLLRRRELATRPAADAPDRPPDRRRARHAGHVAAADPSRVPATSRMAP